jgi:hypothetical protein
MSNIEPYPTPRSEAAVRVKVAERIRQSGIVVAAVSAMPVVAHAGYKAVEQLPGATDVNTEVKGSLIVLSVSSVIALGSAAYETVVRHRHGLSPEELFADKLSILEPTES